MIGGAFDASFHSMTPLMLAADFQAFSSASSISRRTAWVMSSCLLFAWNHGYMQRNILLVMLVQCGWYNCSYVAAVALYPLLQQHQMVLLPCLWILS
jgi:hypothetical protein